VNSKHREEESPYHNPNYKNHIALAKTLPAWFLQQLLSLLSAYHLYHQSDIELSLRKRRTKSISWEDKLAAKGKNYNYTFQP